MLTCQQIVDLITAYLEGDLPAHERLGFEKHVAICPPCRAHLAQMRRVIATTGTLTVEDVSSEAELALRHAFRDWDAARGDG